MTWSHAVHISPWPGRWTCGAVEAVGHRVFDGVAVGACRVVSPVNGGALELEP